MLDPSAPPRSPANGITPQTTKRRDAFVRPSMRSGVIACTRLMPLTFVPMAQSPNTNWAVTMNGIA